MKVYYVTATGGANELGLFTTGKENFTSTSYEEAKAFYDAELAEARALLTPAEELEYEPSEYEYASEAVYITLCAVDPEADDMADECIDLETSEALFGLKL